MKKLSKFAFALLLSVTAGSLISSTVAWFKFGTDVSFGGNADDKVKVNAGISNGYFGGGDGSAETPYIISSKTHLYNLAWLQYLGYFDGSSEPKQSLQPYFKLTNDINMNGITLPPIGTEEYPFLGNFNGQNHTISNLTVSNDYSDFGTAKPVTITSADDFNPPEIVGFFGTVGNLPDQGLTYSSSIISMTNFTLENITVNSETNKTLIGLAAGYVNLDVETISETETGAEGNMSGVKVSGTSSINVDGQTAVDATNITN